MNSLPLKGYFADKIQGGRTNLNFEFNSKLDKTRLKMKILVNLGGFLVQEPGLDSYAAPKAPAATSSATQQTSDRRSSEDSSTLLERIRSSYPNRRLKTLSKEFWSQLPVFFSELVGKEGELDPSPNEAGPGQNQAGSFSSSVEK